MERKLIGEKIYISVLSVLTAVSLFWIFMSDIDIAAGIGEIWAWTLILSVINTIRDIIKNKAVTIGIAVYIVFVIIYMWLVEKDLVSALLIAGIFILYIVLNRLLVNMIFRISVGLLCPASLLAMYFFRGDFHRLLVVMVLILMLNSIAEILYIAGINRCNGKSLLIIYIIIGAVLMFTPVKDEPYDWNFFVKIGQKIEKMLSDAFLNLNYYFQESSDEYEYAYTGYSGRGASVIGELMDNENIQLVVSGSKTNSSLYLTGSVSDTFNGRSWSQNDKKETISDETDSWMTLYACYYLYGGDTAEISKFMQVKNQSVTFENIKTKSTFLPLKTIINSGEDQIQDGDNKKLKSVGMKKYEYSYTFFDFDYANIRFRKILEKADKVKYVEQVWNELLEYMESNYEVAPSFTFKELKDAAEKSDTVINSKYTTKSKELSDRAKALEKSLVAGCSTDYEKCQVLTSYMQKYKYNKQVAIPEDSNIIDYFLFEGKEGYCVHYATALTEMLKYEGIPARFVEGFHVNYGRPGDTNEEYCVVGNDAHAWVEAYIKGFGWIRLEPVFVQYSWEGMTHAVDESDIGDVETDSLTEKDTYAAGNSFLMLFVPGNRGFIFLVGAAIVIAVIFIITLIYRWRKSVNSIDPDFLSKDILRILKKSYGKKKESETLSEYFDRLDIDWDVKIYLYDVKSVMEKIWYSQCDIQEEEIDYLKRTRKVVKSAILK